MLKNMKVGTKLVAIIAAPILVLVALAVVGVQQRFADRAGAEEAAELTEFAGINAALVQELQLEAMYSTLYASSGKDAELKGQLDAQRVETDTALVAYEEASSSLDLAGEGPAIAEAVQRANERLDKLGTVRKSVDDVQADALNIAGQYNETTSDLVGVNASLSLAIDDTDINRTYSSFVALSRAKNYEAYAIALQSIAVQTGFYAAVLPSGTQTEPLRDPDGAVGCGDDAAANISSCPIYAQLTTARTDTERAVATYNELATARQKEIQRDTEVGTFETLAQSAFEGGDGRNEVQIVQETWIQAATERLDNLYAAEQSILSEATTAANDLADEARNAATLYVLGALGAIVIALVITFLVARAITVPLRRLTSAAYTLSTERLPALVERLRNPEGEESQESLAATLTPIDIHSKDEIGQLADSFNSIQQVTVEVAEEQAQLLRKGIGDIFINLARRNQTLLDRQIEFIDQLEANEEDPDQLDNLFKLDHLATRMRRNAESLLVLAGAEPPRRRGRPVSLADVVRVAIGEVEDFARIQLLALDEATVGGNVAVDLAHLLSELMENATHFSPPDTMVEVVGHRTDAGYTISISDQGIGMSPEQLAEANVQLARPPLVGLALSRSLGFIVIGRLAQRFDIVVKLTASPSGGVTALVTLPPDLVTFEGEEHAPTSIVEQAAAEVGIEAAPAEPETVEAAAVADELEVVEELEVVAESEVAATAVEEPPVEEPAAAATIDELVEEAVGSDEEFERGLQSLVSDELAPGPAEAPPLVEEPAAEQPVAEQPATLTAAGLVKRTPKKRAATPAGANAAGGPVRTTGQSTRSPEEVRKMLSRYRSGLNKGKGGADGDESIDS